MISFRLSPFLTWYFTLLAFLLGAVMGSFLNCAAWRTARHESFIKGRSRCPACGHVLAARDLIPLASWLSTRGTCRYCGDRVSWRYPLTEAFFGLVTVLCLWKFDLTVLCLRNYVFLCCLFFLSLTDMENRTIPDGALLIASGAWLLALPFCWAGTRDMLLHLGAALAYGAAVLALSLVMDRALGRESLGGGDVKLFALCGLYLGFAGGLFAVIFACVLGLVTAAIAKRRDIAFGPAISAAAAGMLLWGDGLIGWYMNLF